MNKKHLVFVPKNEQAVKDFEEGTDTKDQFIVYEISEDEFDILWKHHVFDILNEKYDLWIDECEEETVTATQLKELYDAISFHKGSWLDAVNKAIEIGTCAYLHF